MFNYYEINLTGFPEVLFVLALSFIWCLLITYRIGAFDNHPANLMIEINNPLSFILFLHIFRRKVTVWGVIMQLCNYIAIVIAIVIYVFLGLNGYTINKTFIRIIFSYMAVLTVGAMVDFVIYLIKHKEF